LPFTIIDPILDSSLSSSIPSSIAPPSRRPIPPSPHPYPPPTPPPRLPFASQPADDEFLLSLAFAFVLFLSCGTTWRIFRPDPYGKARCFTRSNGLIQWRGAPVSARRVSTSCTAGAVLALPYQTAISAVFFRSARELKAVDASSRLREARAATWAELRAVTARAPILRVWLGYTCIRGRGRGTRQKRFRLVARWL
jgi:hypothetical protein